MRATLSWLLKKSLVEGGGQNNGEGVSFTVDLFIAAGLMSGEKAHTDIVFVSLSLSFSLSLSLSVGHFFPFLVSKNPSQM